MAELIAVPLKKPSDVDVIKPLTNLIKSAYSSADNQKDYTEAVTDFSKLRNNALWRAFEKYESSLEVIYRYESSLIKYYFCHNYDNFYEIINFIRYCSTNFTCTVH